MAQHDYDIANGTGFDVRTDLNNVFSAIATNNSGTSAPSTTFANMWWYDTANSLLKRRDAANTAWITAAATFSAVRALPAANTDTFTGLPPGLRLIRAQIENVSADAAGNSLAMRIGDSGGIETASYETRAFSASDGASTTISGGFLVENAGAAANALSGVLTLSRVDTAAHKWAYTGHVFNQNGDELFLSSGVKTLSGELTQAQLWWNVGANFDAGSWRLIYI